MQELMKRLALIGLVAALAGCNSTDALTPQVDVGGGGFNSPPVTQNDLDQMSAQTTPVTTTRGRADVTVAARVRGERAMPPG